MLQNLNLEQQVITQFFDKSKRERYLNSILVPFRAKGNVIY